MRKRGEATMRTAMNSSRFARTGTGTTTTRAFSSSGLIGAYGCAQDSRASPAAMRGLERGDFGYFLRIELGEHLHQEVDGAIKVGTVDYAVVRVKIASRDGNIRRREAAIVSL